MRRSKRTIKPPNKFSPENIETYKEMNSQERNLDEMGKPLPIGNDGSNLSKSLSTSSRRLRMQVELEKLEEMNKLERLQEEKEAERQRQLEAKELERQRQLEAKELERQKRLIEARAALKSISHNGSLYSCSKDSCSKVGLDENIELEENSECKVERWLGQEPSVHMSSSAIMTTAVQKLADSLRQAVHPVSLRPQLPTFSGKPDEWPIFYAAFEKTKGSFSEEDNFSRLRNCLEGDALKMVKPLFISSKNLSSVIKTLQMHFGRPELVMELMLKKTKMLLPVQEDDINSLIEFSTNILNYTTIAESLHVDNYMSNPQFLSELLNKLPYSLKYNWAKYISEMSVSKPDLRDFSNWLEKECSILSIYFHPKEDNTTRKKQEMKPVFTNSNKESLYYCVFCGEKHEFSKCMTFRKANVAERWKMVAEKKLCFFCFHRHQLKYCKQKRACGINGCKLFHHRLLHTEKTDNPSKRENKEIIGKHTENIVTNHVLLKVCPVTLYGPKCHVNTYALLDDGSTVTLLDSTMANTLGVEGKIEPLTTCWSNTARHFDPTSRSVSVGIKGLYESDIFTLTNVRTQSPLDLPQQNIDTVKLRKRWTHLSSIDQPLPTAHAKPTILIGQDNCNLILIRKVFEGPTNSPILSWSYLGWTLHGKSTEHQERVDEDFTLTSYENDTLHSMVKESFRMDSYGDIAGEPKRKLPEEVRAIEILENTTKKVGSRYESGLLWKSDNFKFPPSYDNALKRYKTIQKKMVKNPAFKLEYQNKIEDYIDKGYVTKLSKEEASITSDRTYYLPHFGVTNPNKPNKLRLVFDAAAKSHGVSFNDALLSGPDYLNSLPSVLLKFRLGKYAIAGDIKEMFHQVHIRDEDVDSQRFLWQSEDPTQEPDTYIMKAMTFGSTCSPSTALFVVNKNAKQFSSIYPEASKSILTKEYMDDLLDSTDTVEEAKKRVQEITEIHKAGGFQICNWLSNSKDVLLGIADNLKAQSTKLLKEDSSLPTERVLGMWWDAEHDNFVFYRNADKLIFAEILYPTKREVLRAAMSIFDPLGLVSPTTIKGRLLVQDIWRTKVSWDEVLTTEHCIKWQNWLDEIKNLQSFEIPRCYFQAIKLENIELHVFVDASEEAFAAVAYLYQNEIGLPKTMLVMSRAKVASLKPITIPRLELQAALLGCRLAKNIENDINIPFSQRIFWTDSVTVLHWIKSQPKCFKQFVSNRIGEIQEISKPEEWRWVSSKENPADIPTRRNKKFDLKIQNEWIYGPNFLSLNKDDWPKQPKSLQHDITDEVKRQFVGTHNDKQPQVIDINRFSSWERLSRTVAWVLRYIKLLQLRIIVSNDKKKLIVKQLQYDKITELQPTEIKKAEKIILRISQGDSFVEEKNILGNTKDVPTSSRIYKLTPFLDEDDLIKMSTRVNNSPELSEEQKQPIILDGKSHVAKLIVKMYHELCFHQGTETVISLVRKKFWILSLRNLVKRIKKTCMRCKINNAKPRPPQMAPLPESRVKRVEHPFYFTGVDYFGPLEVTVGRRHEKRWGVLFTCLSTRAIHMEVAHSLNTESCIMAIQRFISRRPCPSEFFSDNGTNFVAAEKELHRSVKSLNHVHIQRTLTSQEIKWNFIPPRAPHMGGCWERLIRSVKTALRTVMKCQYPRDEELQTLLIRIEFIINSRPLTHVSIDPTDTEPLTPNHFLREGFKIQIEEDQLCKRQLTRVKALLDNFWKRWIREYLPCLTRRCKWHCRVEPPEVGNLAIMVEENNPRNTWPLGIISSIFKSCDGQVRTVEIKTNKGTFRRPLTKVAVLSWRGEDVND